MRRAALAALLIVAVATCAASAKDGAFFLGPSTLDAPVLPLIPEVRSAHGTVSVSLRAALDARGRPAFYWHGSEIAPTIRLHPGDVLHVHYVNDLPQFCGLGMVSDTNLHFHGLTVAPVPPGDDVITTNVAPRKSYDYTIAIGAHEPPGLYWYHPHPHGMANWQIGNGMSGAIVIEGAADAVPSIAGLRERVIVLRDVPNDPSLAAAETPERRAPATVATSGDGVASVPGVSADDFQGDTPCGVEGDAQTTINGIPSATIGIRPGERQYWRVLNASGHRHFDLAIAGEKLGVVALDGVPLRAYPNAPALEMRDHIVIPPGGRAEIVVTGPVHPQLLLSRCFDAGVAGDINPAAVLGELVDDHGTTRSDRVAAADGRAMRVTGVAAPAARRRIRFDEDAKTFSLNGIVYRPGQKPMFTARSGTLEEWTLENDTDEVHTFHLHQVHFVVESTAGIRERDPHWRDVVDIPPRKLGPHGEYRPSLTRVLIDFRDPVVRGTFLFHCHIVDHEDLGMMAKIRVI